MYTRAVQCPFCPQQLDRYGIHASHCVGAGDATHRHNMVRDVLASAASAGRISHKLEVGYLLTDDRSGPKPADLLLYHWDGGQSVCIDVSIANSFHFLTDTRPFVAMEALRHKESEKYRKYSEACAARDLVLHQPFVCGSLGGLTDVAVYVLKKLGGAVSAATGRSRERVIADLRSQIAFVVQKAQATAWLRRGDVLDILA